MIRQYVILTVLCVVAGQKWNFDSLRKSTNELDTEILSYYETLPDKLTDIALQSVRDYLNLNNDTKIDIPPIDVGFIETILGIDLKGEFKANNGVFRNPATIVRKGESTMKWPSLVHSVVSTTIGFTDLEVYFPYYEASVVGITENGDVKVVVGKNKIFLQVSVILVPKCTVTLTNLTMTELSGISTDISGLGVLDGLADLITGWILNSYETSLTGIIENVVANKLSEVLVKTGGFCKYKAPVKQLRLPGIREISCRRVKKFSYKCSAK